MTMSPINITKSMFLTPPQIIKIEGKTTVFHNAKDLILNIPESKPNPTQQKLNYAFLHLVVGRSDVT